MIIELKPNQKINLSRLESKVGGAIEILQTPGTYTEVGKDGKENVESHGYVIRVEDELVEKLNEEIVAHNAEADDEVEEEKRKARSGHSQELASQIIEALKSDKVLRKTIRLIVRQSDDD